MEEYRKKLKNDLVWYRVLMVVFICLFVAVVLVDKSRLYIDYVWYTGMLGGLFGVTFGRYRNAKTVLSDEEAFRRAYVESHDERSILVAYRAADATFIISLYGLSIAGVIASFFNLVVFYTLLITVLALIAVNIGIHMYYWKKM